MQKLIEQGDMGGHKLGQIVNWPGIVTAIKVLVCRQKSLLIPHLTVMNINEIDFDWLKANGIKGVVFDKDNCLTEPYSDELHDCIGPGFANCKRTFGESVLVYSNFAGSANDTDHKAAISLEKTLGVDVLRHSSKKPGGFDSVEHAFHGCSPDELMMVGDRHFTDIVFGNINGMLTVHTFPFTSTGENFAVKLARGFETRLVSQWTADGVKAPPHRIAELMSNTK